MSTSIKPHKVTSFLSLHALEKTAAFFIYFSRLCSIHGSKDPSIPAIHSVFRRLRVSLDFPTDAVSEGMKPMDAVSGNLSVQMQFSTEPCKPGKPSKPGKPGKSGKPRKPGKPGKPGKPSKPGKPGK